MINCTSKNRYLHYLLITLVLLIATLLRLYKIDLPLINHHAMRQNFDAMYAYNFYQHGLNILTPLQNGEAEKLILVIGDFPIFPYLVALLYKITGINEITGRLLSLFFSIASIFYLYLLVKKTIGFKSAIWTSLILSLSPLHIYGGNAFMRQSMVLFLMIAAIYYFIVWLETQKPFYMVLIIAITALAGCMNPPALLIGLPFCYLSLHSNHRNQREFWLWLILMALCIIFPIYKWIQYGRQHTIYSTLVNTQIPSLRNWADPKYYLLWLDKYFFISLFDYFRTIIIGPIGFVLMILGLGTIKSSGEKYLWIWLFALLLYYALDPYVVYIVPHTYYFIQMTPIAAFFSAKGLIFIQNKIQNTRRNKHLSQGLSLLAVMSITLLLVLTSLDQLFYAKCNFYDVTNINRYFASECIRQITPENAIIATDDGHRIASYYMNRINIARGEMSLTNLEYFKNKGFNYYALTNIKDLGNNDVIQNVSQKYHIEEINNNYIIYNLLKNNPDKWIGNDNIDGYTLVGIDYSNGTRLAGYKFVQSYISNQLHLNVHLLWNTSKSLSPTQASQSRLPGIQFIESTHDLADDSIKSLLTIKYPPSYQYKNQTGESANDIVSNNSVTIFIVIPQLGYYKTHPLGFGYIDPFLDNGIINESIDILQDHYSNLESIDVLIGLLDNNGIPIAIVPQRSDVNSTIQYYKMTLPLKRPSITPIFMINWLMDHIKNIQLFESNNSSNIDITKYQYPLNDSKTTIEHNTALMASANSIDLLNENWVQYLLNNNDLRQNKITQEQWNLLQRYNYFKKMLLSGNQGFPDHLNGSTVTYQTNLNPYLDESTFNKSKGRYEINTTKITGNELLDGIYCNMNFNQLTWRGNYPRSLLQENEWWHATKYLCWPQGNIIDINFDLKQCFYLTDVRLIAGGFTLGNAFHYKMVLIYSSCDGTTYTCQGIRGDPYQDSGKLYLWNYNNINTPARYLKVRIVGDDDLYYMKPNFVRLDEVEIWGAVDPHTISICELREYYDEHRKTPPPPLNKSLIALQTMLNNRDYTRAHLLLQELQVYYPENHDVQKITYSLKSIGNYLVKNMHTNQYTPKDYMHMINVYEWNMDNTLHLYLVNCSNYLKQTRGLSLGSLINNDTTLPLINRNPVTYSFSTIPELFNKPFKGNELIDRKAYNTESQLAWNQDNSHFVIRDMDDHYAFSPEVKFDLKKEFILDNIRIESHLITASYDVTKMSLQVSKDDIHYYPILYSEISTYNSKEGCKMISYLFNNIDLKARYFKIQPTGKPGKLLVLGEVYAYGYDLPPAINRGAKIKKR